MVKMSFDLIEPNHIDKNCSQGRKDLFSYIADMSP